MTIGFLGAGTWGFCLASLLSSKGHAVKVWTREEKFAQHLQKTKTHPKLPNFVAEGSISFTTDLKEVIQGSIMIVESVTCKGIRPVFEKIATYGKVSCPIVVTSKGIEQSTSFLIPEIITSVLGKEVKDQICVLSGPSHSEEVIHKLPTSIVCAASDPKILFDVQEAFSTPFFRIYPNADVSGVCFGGAMKNIIAIACGISDGLGFGDNTKAALMTRGLHEIRKLSVTKQAHQETLNGLAGMGDLCVTCLSRHSRNYTFGNLIAQGLSFQEAKDKIGMVVEGPYTCISARELAAAQKIAIPITDAVYSILYEEKKPQIAVKELLQRLIKEEHQ